MIRTEDCRDWDNAIRKGRAGEVRKTLKGLGNFRVPRPLASSFANIARRCGLHGVSIRVLNPIVRPERARLDPATPAELAEYGMALVNIGAIDEGRAILLKIRVSEFPSLPLLLAQSYLPEWKYREALKVLEPFVEDKNSDPYLRLVAQVNLCAAYLYEGQYLAAESLLAETLSATEQLKLFLLRGNLLEIRSQLLIEQKRFNAAREALASARMFVENTGTTDALYVEKWSSLIELYEQPDSVTANQRVVEVQSQARLEKSWETIRDLDRHLAVTQMREDLYHHLYFGSPHVEYRQRLNRTLSFLPLPKNVYNRKMNPSGRNVNHFDQFDVLNLTFNGKAIGLKDGQLLHRLLLVLSTDFYRPFPTASLLSKIFPGEYYNQISSPNRIHQLIKRLREVLNNNKTSIVIEESEGGYRLSSQKPVELLLNLVNDPFEDVASANFKHRTQIAKLENRAHDRNFTAKQAAEWMDASRSSATRLLRVAIEQDEIEKTGTGAQTCFRFKRRKNSAA